MATVVGRVGWAWDRWLVYGQGGWTTAKTGFRRIQTNTSSRDWILNSPEIGNIARAGLNYQFH
jgi:hypothetical protein